MRGDVQINGNGNVVGNNNTVLADSEWAIQRQRAQIAVNLHLRRARELQRWAIAVISAAMLIPLLLAPRLGPPWLLLFGAFGLLAFILNAKAQSHRADANRLWTYYGLF